MADLAACLIERNDAVGDDDSVGNRGLSPAWARSTYRTPADRSAGRLTCWAIAPASGT